MKSKEIVLSKSKTIIFGIIIVLGSILVGFILISMKYEKKAKKQDK